MVTTFARAMTGQIKVIILGVLVVKPLARHAVQKLVAVPKCNSFTTYDLNNKQPAMVMSDVVKSLHYGTQACCLLSINAATGKKIWSDLKGLAALLQLPWTTLM